MLRVGPMLLAAFIVACGGGAPLAYEPEWAAGREGRLQVDGGADQLILLALQRDDVEAVGKALRAGDGAGIVELVRRGRALLVSNGTKVLVIDTAVFVRQVRVLDGDQAGRAGWIPTEFIRPLSGRS